MQYIYAKICSLCRVYVLHIYAKYAPAGTFPVSLSAADVAYPGLGYSIKPIYTRGPVTVGFPNPY